MGRLGSYLKAKGLSSEIAALMVDETKLQLEGTNPVYRHPDLQIQEQESQMVGPSGKSNIKRGLKMGETQEVGASGALSKDTK